MSTSVIEASAGNATGVRDVWRQFYLEWPDDIPKRGIVVNTEGEQHPFKGYMVKQDMLLLERTNPDPLGSRFILMTFESISAVKLIDSLQASVFEGVGFEGVLHG